MYEIDKSIQTPVGQLAGVTSCNAGLYVVSNERNKILRYNINGEIKESFDGLSYAPYLDCTAICSDTEYLYIALKKGEVWRKNISTKEEDLLFLLDAVSGVTIQDNKIIAFSQREGKISSWSKSGERQYANSLPYSIKGMVYNESDHYIYAVDQITGKIIKLELSPDLHEYVVMEEMEGIYPFASSYFEGDITFNSRLISCSGNAIHYYVKSPYSFFVKNSADEWIEKEILEILNVTLGDTKILDVKVVNTSSARLPLFNILLGNSDSSLASYVTLSTTGEVFGNSVELGALEVGEEHLFKIKFEVPKTGVEGEALLQLNIDWR